MSAVVIMLMANIFHCSKVTNAVADALRTENLVHGNKSNNM